MKAFAIAGIATLVSACDLVPDVGAFRRSFVKDRISSDADPCLQAENCLGGPGMRTVIRFDSHVRNIGRTDCTIGWTPKCPIGDDSFVPPQFPFQYDQCHKHWHFNGFSEYTLHDEFGNVVGTGQKNGLCLMDVLCTGGRKKFTCQNQGISPGCTDVYNKGLDCQWIDITDLPGGTERGVYTMRWKTNSGQLLPETNYSNNEAEVEIDLARIPYQNVRESAAPNQCPGAGRGYNSRSSSTFDWNNYNRMSSGSERRAYRRACRNGNC